MFSIGLSGSKVSVVPIQQSVCSPDRQSATHVPEPVQNHECKDHEVGSLPGALFLRLLQ